MTQYSFCGEMKTIPKASTFMKSTINYVIPQISTDNMSLCLVLDAGNFYASKPSCVLHSLGLSRKAKCSGETPPPPHRVPPSKVTLSFEVLLLLCYRCFVWKGIQAAFGFFGAGGGGVAIM